MGVVTEVKKRQIIISLSLFAFGTLVSGCLFLFIMANPTAYPITASILFFGSLILPGTFMIVRPKQWPRYAIVAAAYCLVSGAIIATYGQTHAWAVFSDLRASWGRRMAPEMLKSQLVAGDTPENILEKVGIAPGILDGSLSYLVYGMSRSMVLEAYGASREMLTLPDDGDPKNRYLVWAYPICGGGCCDGAVVLTFQDNHLNRVEIYDPSTNPGPETDVARYSYTDGQVWTAISGAKKRFSPKKTLEQIHTSNPTSLVVLAEIEQ